MITQSLSFRVLPKRRLLRELPEFNEHQKGSPGFGLGFRVWGLGFRVWGLGFGVWGLGFGVWGLGLGFGV